MSKKIGILTFHYALNYGAVLQAYALQDYIERLTGEQIEIIDYAPSRERNTFEAPKVKFNNIIKQFVGNLILQYYSHSFKKRQLRFQSFAKNFHKLSEIKYSSISDFEYNNFSYDTLITGSDQVFNLRKDSQIYYLGFNNCNSTKIAYAPSIGLSSLRKDQIERIAPWVNDFDTLSCRESEGAEILSSISGKSVPVVCDPVFLVPKSRWESLAVLPPYKDYIFVFDLNGGKSLFKLALELKEQTGLPIIYSSLKGIHLYIKSCKTRHDLGPREWVGYILNAKYTVTDSFHGTALSLILGTKVLTQIAAKSTSSRITSMLKRLNIEDQLIDDTHPFDLSKIRFAKYKSEMNQFISDSEKFIQAALS